MYCKNCGAEIDDKAVICPKCGVLTETAKSFTPSNESASGGLKVISLLLPVIGLILFLVYNEKEPVKAKECGKFALIGAGIGVGLGILYTIVIGSLISSFY